MKKFKCTVTKTYDYEIEIDEKVWTEENIKGWASVFEDADTLEDIVAILAERKTRYDFGEYIEGFGVPMINGRKPSVSMAGVEVSEDINIILEDEDCEVEIDEFEGE